MSQNSRNTGNEGQRGSDRSGTQKVRSSERKGLEGFEGMNYEQIRGPYNPSGSGGNRNNPTPDSDTGQRRERN